METLKELYEKKGELHFTLEVTQARLQKVTQQIIKLTNEEKPEEKPNV